MNTMRLDALLVVLILGVSATRGQDGCEGDAVACLMACPFGYMKDHKGCNVCECLPEKCQDFSCPSGKNCRAVELTDGTGPAVFCSDPRLPGDCQLPKDPGSCKGLELRWFYDNEADTCANFTYGGCQGNGNKFDARDECLTRCQLVSEGSCSPAKCMMFCENGFKVDERGCDMCQCKDDVDTEVDGEQVECDDSEFAKCAIACPHGFHRDDNGCKMCKCHEHGDEHVEHYQEGVDCSPVTCMSHCEHDYKKDSNGCNLCECKEPECSEIQCHMACPHGFRKDPEGCDECVCRTEEECNGYQCRMTCPYGFLKDKSGCNMCICHDNCEETKCNDDMSCLVVNTGLDYEAKCLHFQNHKWCSDQIMCTMHCEHGFKSDSRGCPTCGCLEAPPPKCEMERCEGNFCPFGHGYTEEGCFSCDCIEDPCTDFECPDEEQVCEVFHQKKCLRCPPEPRCLAIVEVKRIRVDLVFTHPAVEDLDVEELEEAIMEKMSDLFDVDDDLILGVGVRVLDETSTAVRFHVLAKGDAADDLVEDLEDVKEMLKQNKTEHAITLEGGTRFVPVPDKMVASYSSDSDIPDHEMWDDGEDELIDTQTIIIIAAAAAGAIVVIAIVVIVMACKRNKRKPESSRNVTYSKAGTTDNVRVTQQKV